MQYERCFNVLQSQLPEQFILAHFKRAVEMTLRLEIKDFHIPTAPTTMNNKRKES